MDSLKSIQKTFRIFLRLTHAAKILCIVGAVKSMRLCCSLCRQAFPAN